VCVGVCVYVHVHACVVCEHFSQALDMKFCWMQIFNNREWRWITNFECNIYVSCCSKILVNEIVDSEG